MGLAVKSSVKELVKGDYSVGADFFEALDKEIERLVKRAGERASANNRKTLKARDL